MLSLVLGKGLRLALIGVVMGIAGALAVAPVVKAAASELPVHDPDALFALALVLVVVARLPARRAAMDPMVALRQE